MKCKRCNSYAIKKHLHGRNGTDSHLCDVCFWRVRAELLYETLKKAVERQGFSNDELFDARDVIRGLKHIRGEK